MNYPESPNSNSATVSAESVGLLRKFIRGEIAAVETYTKAVATYGNDYPVLEEILESHRQRVQLLQQHLLEMNEDPSTGSGVWGSFTKTLTTLATMTSGPATIALLEEGEDRGLLDYRDNLAQLDAQCRAFIDDKILPLQQHTHDVMSKLKHSL